MHKCTCNRCPAYREDADRARELYEALCLSVEAMGVPLPAELERLRRVERAARGLLGVLGVDPDDPTATEWMKADLAVAVAALRTALEDA